MNDNIAFICVDIARLFRKQYADAAREFSGTGAQWRALLVISRSPGINQGALAEKLDVEPITTCRLIDRMAQAGLVERRRDPTDRRVWQLFTTDSATPTIQALQEVGAVVINKALSGFDDDELDILRKFLDRLRANLSDLDLTDKELRHG